MKVCGFTFIRNGVKFDYPFEQSIRSIVPLCDVIIVAVGRSDDDTLAKVRSIDPKIRILETEWDDTQKEGGRVLALETDKAFQAVPAEFDWAFYIQGDEVVHEKDYTAIRAAMEKYKGEPQVEGLLFNYKHFFGSYDYVGAKYSWYRREIRVIRNDKNIFSYRDAQGFRKKPNEKLHVKLIDAEIYHYGWVRNPGPLQQKIKANIHLYKGNNIEEQQKEFNKDVYEYNESKEPVIPFTGTHPAVMKERIAQQNWEYEPDTVYKYASLKDWVKRFLLKYTGWAVGEYKNYKRI